MKNITENKCFFLPVTNELVYMYNSNLPSSLKGQSSNNVEGKVDSITYYLILRLQFFFNPISISIYNVSI